MKIRELLIRLLPAFGREDVICRLLSSWLSASLMLLLFGSASYGNLAYSATVSFPLLILVFCFFFIALCILKFFLRSYPTEPIALFSVALMSAIHWLSDKNDPFLTLGVFAFLTLVTLYAAHHVSPLFDKIRISRRALLISIVAVAAVSCTLIAIVGCLRYLCFFASNFDFGLFCDMFYGMKETGLPMTTSERDKLLSHFAVHISPIYYLILPFFCIFPSPLTLQIAQAVIVVLGVIPLALLAKHFGLSRGASLFLSALYLFYPALASGCFYDIHENCFLPLLLLSTFYFYEKKQPIPMYVTALLVLSVKEDAAVYLFLFAVYLLLSRRSYIHGAILSVLSLSYFSLALFILNKFGDGAMIGRFDNLIYDKSEGLIGAVKAAIANPGYLLTQLFSADGSTPGKVIYFLQMMLPLGFLPFLTKKASRWLLVAPMLLNLLTAYVYQYDIGFQYHFGILAFLFYATVQNLPELSSGIRTRALALALSGCICFFSAAVFPSLGYYVDTYAAEKDHYKEMEKALDLIPKDASVSASGYLLAHIADRAVVYEVYYHGNKTDVDYVALDLRYGSDVSKTTRYYETRGYRVLAELEGLLLILVSPRVK